MAGSRNAVGSTTGESCQAPAPVSRGYLLCSELDVTFVTTASLTLPAMFMLAIRAIARACALKVLAGWSIMPGDRTGTEHEAIESQSPDSDGLVAG